MTYAEAIKKIRSKMLLAQMEFAQLLGFSFASIYRWETGKYEPTKLAKVKIEHLFAEYEVMIEVKENA